MSEGTLYHFTGARSTPAVLVAKKYNLPFKISERDDTFKKNFPTQKVPALLFSDPKKGNLQEIVAILWYFSELVKEQTNGKTLIHGSSALETAQVLKWTSLATSNLLNSIYPASVTVIPDIPVSFPQEECIKTLKESKAYVTIIEERIKSNKYLVGDTLTVADILIVYTLSYPFATVWGKDFQEEHKELYEYIKRNIESDLFQTDPFYKNFKFAEKSVYDY